MARSVAGWPQPTQAPEPPGCSMGMQRIVARVSSLILASQSALPAPEGESEAVFDGFFQVVVGFCVVRIALSKRQGLVVQRLLNLGQQPFRGRRQISQRSADLPFSARAVAAR